MDFSKSNIKHLIIHEIGNKLRDEKVLLSEALQDLDEDLEKILLNYFLKLFLVEKDLFKFHHNSNINLNEVYTYSQDIFNSDKDLFITTSQNIAKHLYEYTLHPKITKGELIVVQISNVNIDNNEIDLIGIFKSDNKETFLKLLRENTNIKIKTDVGINISKLDKGCLILNTNEDSGYTVLNIDNHRQSTDYWTNKFLNLKIIDNNSHKTREILKLCRGFSNEILSTKYDKDIEFNFNNDFINYFEGNTNYDISSFKENIFKNENIEKDFFEYRESNKSFFDINLDEQFELIQKDINTEKKKVKNIIKLDTKLELKVLLDKEGGIKNLEKGFDEEKGMFFYKIYFNEEIK
ncbi:MAG: hypothetical protein COB23_06435 [Methylophaga sp.]|nr:MAG: hypothetical protein COB23_06435 [Methylophaga sp.]